GFTPQKESPLCHPDGRGAGVRVPVFSPLVHPRPVAAPTLPRRSSACGAKAGPFRPLCPSSPTPMATLSGPSARLAPPDAPDGVRELHSGRTPRTGESDSIAEHPASVTPATQPERDI